jgi:outer membrane lipoprotein
MKSGSRRRPWKRIVILAALLPTGCTSAISREALKEADQHITFERLLENPEAYRGRTVLLGGDIIETQNLPLKTLIIVLQRPLDHRKKPVSGDVSKGRFIVSVQGFLDPAIYSEGRKITVVGSIAGGEVRALGETVYSYPIVSKRELVIWPLERPYGAWPKVRFGLGLGVRF